MSELAVASINERAAEEFFRKAQEAEGHGQHERAVDFYERTLHENPDHEQGIGGDRPGLGVQSSRSDKSRPGPGGILGTWASPIWNGSRCSWSGSSK